MNHGGRRRTMAAMVPHPWLRSIETSANMSYNKAASLKLELIIFNGTSYSIFCHYNDYGRVKLRTKHKQNQRQTHFSTMAAAVIPWPPWCPPDFAEHRKNCQDHRPSFTLMEGMVGRDGMPLRFDGCHGSVASFVSEL